jgi:predicted nuclease of predicted toxin-antitoxin system
VKLLIDMNLSPRWVPYLSGQGREAVHWSTLGPGKATDQEIMQYARNKKWVVFTHDLDFGALLAKTNALGPSVIQVRCSDPDPAIIGKMVVQNLLQFTGELIAGALLTLEPDRQRVRLLPLRIHPAP